MTLSFVLENDLECPKKQLESSTSLILTPKGFLEFHYSFLETLYQAYKSYHQPPRIPEYTVIQKANNHSTKLTWVACPLSLRLHVPLNMLKLMGGE